MTDADDEPTPVAPEEHPAGDARPAGQRRRGGLIGSVIGRVAPTVIDNIDIDQVLDAVDVDQVAERLDLNALVERMDVDAVAARLDLDALVNRMDVDAVAARLDLDALVNRMDVDAVASRLDLDSLVNRMDVDAVAAKLDLNALVGRIDMTQLTADASGEFAQSGLDLARRQVIRADAAVETFVERTVLRRSAPRPDSPSWMPEAETEAGLPVVDPDPAASGAARRDVSGHYAGAVSRVLAVALDFTASFGVYGLMAAALSYLFRAFTPDDLSLTPPDILPALLVIGWLVLWLWVPVAILGRTPAMALIGLAVLRRSGGDVGTSRALVRALVEPLAVLIAIIAFAGVVLGRQRRALHDAVAGTVVVYDWGDRQAEQPAALLGRLSARVRRSPERG